MKYLTLLSLLLSLSLKAQEVDVLNFSLIPESIQQEQHQKLIEESYEDYRTGRNSVSLNLSQELQEVLDKIDVDSLNESQLVYSAHTWQDIDADKQKHIIAGLMINGAIYSFAKLKLGLDDQESYALGVLGATLIGALKEAYDATGRGTVDFHDFTHTVGGAAIFNFNYTYEF